MVEFQKVMKDFYRMCNTYYDAHCFDYPLSNNKNGKYIVCEKFKRIYTEDTEQIIEDWAKKNPVMTNAMKFKEIFGNACHIKCYADYDTCDKCNGVCSKCQ